MATLLDTTITSGNLTITTDGGNVSLPANGYITINASASSPPLPSSNNLTVFARRVGGRMMPAFMGPSGLDSALQPLIARNKIGFWNWIGNATTTALAFGIVAPSVTGTVTARTCSPASLYQSQKRIGYITQTATPNAVSIRTNAAQFWRGNVAGGGGFTLIIRAGVCDPSPVPNAMMFIGFSNTTSAISNSTNTAALTNVIGFGQVPSSNNIQIITNSSTGAASLVDTGLRCNVGNTTIYDYAIFAAPNSSVVTLTVTDTQNSVNTFTTTVTDSGSNLPTPNTMLAIQQWRSNNTAAQVVGLDFVSTYIETDL